MEYELKDIICPYCKSRFTTSIVPFLINICQCPYCRQLFEEDTTISEYMKTTENDV